MKIEIELDLRCENPYLSFWNAYNGDDVICELKNGKLMLIGHNENSEPFPEKEISLKEFCDMVKARAEVMWK